jgi:hypothetical protein
MVTSRWLLLLIAPLFVGAPAAAQQPAPDSTRDRAAAVGSIRGEVFDSLIGERLEGAQVRAVGTALRATTDRQGRFRLDSVPAGSRALVLGHPALDSVGITGLRWTVDVAAGGETPVVLAIPSLGTLARTACAAAPAKVGLDSGIVFGSVRDAERGHRLAGARVVVSWIAIDRRRRPPLARREVRSVYTDSIGDFAACGVARGVGLAVRAIAGPFESGELQLGLGARRIFHYDLSVSREAEAGAVDSVPRPRRGQATLVGSVRRESGGPVPAAQVTVADAAAEAVTDAQGRFMLSELPAGSHMVAFRRIGYGFAAAPVELRNGDTTRVTAALLTVTILDTIRVTASRWVRSEIDELEGRLRNASVGRVRTADDLRGAGSIRTVFYDFPSVQVRWRIGGYSVLMTRGARECSPSVWVDGWRSDIVFLDMYRPSDLIALEVYPSSEVPMRYRDFGACGVVLAWTQYLQ